MIPLTHRWLVGCEVDRAVLYSAWCLAWCSARCFPLTACKACTAWCPLPWSTPLKSSAGRTESSPDRREKRRLLFKLKKTNRNDQCKRFRRFLLVSGVRLWWLTIKPLNAFFSLMWNRPSVDMILMCLMSMLNLEKEQDGWNEASSFRILTLKRRIMTGKEGLQIVALRLTSKIIFYNSSFTGQKG